eukprot:5661221-Pyramimonas_sp.AAC.1
MVFWRASIAHGEDNLFGPVGLSTGPFGFTPMASVSGYGIGVCSRHLPPQVVAYMGLLAEKVRCKFADATAA